jgi:hypothetical protein
MQAFADEDTVFLFLEFLFLGGQDLVFDDPRPDLDLGDADGVLGLGFDLGLGALEQLFGSLRSENDEPEFAVNITESVQRTLSP